MTLYRASLPVYEQVNSGRGDPLEPLVHWARSYDEARRGVLDEATPRGAWYDEDEICVAEHERYACDDCETVWRSSLLTIAIDHGGVLCLACMAGEEPTACRVCGLQIGDIEAEEHGHLCFECAAEAHERDGQDHWHAHSAGEM